MTPVLITISISLIVLGICLLLVNQGPLTWLDEEWFNMALVFAGIIGLILIAITYNYR